jgi:hypothetical protein
VGAERLCPLCRASRHKETTRKHDKKRREQSKEKFSVPGDGEFIFIVRDNTNSFRKNSAFRECSFVASMKERVWPVGMVIRRGNTLSIIDKCNQAMELDTERARLMGILEPITI